MVFKVSKTSRFFHFNKRGLHLKKPFKKVQKETQNLDLALETFHLLEDLI